MDNETKALIESLRAVSAHAEPVANDLMLGTMTPERQRDYAGMLGELSQLLQDHAEFRERSESAVQARPPSRRHPPEIQ
ncbi:hypothetical protein [Amycolatopsis rubida]|uniref:Uncharacterized protein n=1 Tax=Amycolatopsis rubida TaxID=112413 RepID=A0A1I6B3K0_9PSEU|nr:hypothetical protein [Amycolatopsis rubida]SFQ75499.1 hypothetical protein SAMN05421854_12312 [Amycolatopsis rubida]